MSTEATPTGNYYDKYGSRNPVAAWLMGGFFAHLGRCLDRLEGVESVLDVGCGEGDVAGFVRDALPGAEYFALDIDWDLASRTACANPGAHCLVSDACRLPWRDGAFDLVLGIEVLEHLPEPARALEEMARVSRGYVLVSVPNEPLWRILNMMRGSYVTRWGNTPGHVQHWGRAAFRRLLQRRLEVMDESRPLPWLMALCRTPARGSVEPGA